MNIFNLCLLTWAHYYKTFYYISYSVLYISCMENSQCLHQITKLSKWYVLYSDNLLLQNGEGGSSGYYKNEINHNFLLLQKYKTETSLV